MTFTLYNTLTRSVDAFAPEDGKTVRIYSCGLTVYAPMHIGHARTYCFWDVVRRYLEYRNFHVFSVQWTPTRLIFRIDGKETWRIGGRISRVQQYLKLSLLSSDYELPSIADRQLPQHMYVDWVRVWETGT